MSLKVEIKPSGHQYTVEAGETVLEAALRQGFVLPYSCRGGSCGSCKGKLLAGEIEYEDEPLALSTADVENGYALFCMARPVTDCVIEVREIGAAKDITIKTLPCRVAKKELLAPDVMRLYLKLPMVERMQFLPGQYIDVLMKEGRRRSFSLANAPHNDEFLELHIRHVDGGDFSYYVFHEMPDKALLRIEGPLGTFFFGEGSTRPIVFMAGGTGFAPVKSILEHIFSEGMKQPIYFYWGARDKASLYLRELAEKWEQENADFHFIPVLSDPLVEDEWTGRTGFVHEAILQDFSSLRDYDIYACGPPPMIEAAYPTFIAQGLPEDHFYSDAFTYAKDKKA